MNKKVLLGAAAGCAVAGCAAAAAKKNAGAPRQAMWEKMRQRMEEMPEDFPPRMMFDNVEATRANTEEILRLLHQGGADDEASSDDIEVVAST